MATDQELLLSRAAPLSCHLPLLDLPESLLSHVLSQLQNPADLVSCLCSCRSLRAAALSASPIVDLRVFRKIKAVREAEDATPSHSYRSGGGGSEAEGSNGGAPRMSDPLLSQVHVEDEFGETSETTRTSSKVSIRQSIGSPASDPKQRTWLGASCEGSKAPLYVDGPTVAFIIDSLARFVPSVRGLNLSSSGAGDADVSRALQTLCQLRSLCLDSCQKVSEASALALTCPSSPAVASLTTVSLRRCFRMTPESVCLLLAFTASGHSVLRCLLASHVDRLHQEALVGALDRSQPRLNRWTVSSENGSDLVTDSRGGIAAQARDGAQLLMEGEEELRRNNEGAERTQSVEEPHYVGLPAHHEQFQASDLDPDGGDPAFSEARGKQSPSCSHPPIPVAGSGLLVLALHNCSHLSEGFLQILPHFCPRLEALFLGGSAAFFACRASDGRQVLGGYAAGTGGSGGCEGLTGRERGMGGFVRVAAGALAQACTGLLHLRILELTFFPPSLVDLAREDSGGRYAVWDFTEEGSTRAAARLLRQGNCPVENEGKEGMEGGAGGGANVEWYSLASTAAVFSAEDTTADFSGQGTAADFTEAGGAAFSSFSVDEEESHLRRAPAPQPHGLAPQVVTNASQGTSRLSWADLAELEEEEDTEVIQIFGECVVESAMPQSGGESSSDSLLEVEGSEAGPASDRKASNLTIAGVSAAGNHSAGPEESWDIDREVGGLGCADAKTEGLPVSTGTSLSNLPPSGLAATQPPQHSGEQQQQRHDHEEQQQQQGAFQVLDDSSQVLSPFEVQGRELQFRKWDGATGQEELQQAVLAALLCGDVRRRTPLHFAVDKGLTGLLSAQLQCAGAPSNSASYSASNSAAAPESPAQVSLWEVVNARNVQQMTPLFMAAEHGHAAAVESLLAAGADISTSNKSGESPLYIASLKGHVACVKAMLQHCHVAGIDWMDPTLYGDGWTPLMAAAVAERQEVAGLILDHCRLHTSAPPSGDEVSLQSKSNNDVSSVQNNNDCSSQSNSNNGSPSIQPPAPRLDGDVGAEGHRQQQQQRCSESKHLHTLAFINAQNRYGQTALHVSARRGSQWFVDALLSSGASVGIKDGRGHKASAVARKHGHTEVADFLQKLEKASLGKGKKTKAKKGERSQKQATTTTNATTTSTNATTASTTTSAT